MAVIFAWKLKVFLFCFSCQRRKKLISVHFKFISAAGISRCLNLRVTPKLHAVKSIEKVSGLRFAAKIQEKGGVDFSAWGMRGEIVSCHRLLPDVQSRKHRKSEVNIGHGNVSLFHTTFLSRSLNMGVDQGINYEKLNAIQFDDNVDEVLLLSTFSTNTLNIQYIELFAPVSMFLSCFSYALQSLAPKNQ